MTEIKLGELRVQSGRLVNILRNVRQHEFIENIKVVSMSADNLGFTYHVTFNSDCKETLVKFKLTYPDPYELCREIARSHPDIFCSRLPQHFYLSKA